MRKRTGGKVVGYYVDGMFDDGTLVCFNCMSPQQLKDYQSDSVIEMTLCAEEARERAYICSRCKRRIR